MDTSSGNWPDYNAHGVSTAASHGAQTGLNQTYGWGTESGSQYGDGGGWNSGVGNNSSDEQNYPYKGVDQNCAYDKSKAQVKNIGQAYVAPNNAEALKTAIADGPVSVAIEADTFVFQFYSGGVLNSKACGTNLDPGVVAVGYVATDANPYYIVRNSWGASWGVKGYINIAIKDGQGICGIQMEPVIPIF